MPRLKGVAVAAELKLNKSTVSRQARAWGLVGADGLIDLDAYRARRDRELNPLMVREGEAPPPAAGPPPDSVASAAADLKRNQAQLLQLRIEKEAGRQLDAGEVQSAIGEAGALMRSLLGAVPPKLAVTLARIADPDEIERLIAAECDQVLRDYDAALAEAASGDDEDEQEA